MKLFFRYLKSKIWSLAACFVFVGIFIAALLLYHIPVKAVLYPAFVCTLCGLGLWRRDLQSNGKGTFFLKGRRVWRQPR